MDTWKRLVTRVVVGLVLVVGAGGHLDGGISLADHLPGATYTGETSAGGAVTVVLMADGAGISNVGIKGVRSQNCPNVTLAFEQTSFQPAGLAPVQDHRFSKTIDGGAIDGKFLSPQRAEGTARWTSPSARDSTSRPCETGQLTWTATTTAEPAAVTSAPFCDPDVRPELRGVLVDLKAQLGAAMGDPIECEHVDALSSDIVQATTTGLAILRAGTGTPTFTDGARRWGLVDGVLVAWDGGSLDPPSDARAAAPPSSPRPTSTPASIAGAPAPVPPTATPVPPTPTRVPPTPTPRPVSIADATYEGKTAKGNPIRLDTGRSGRTITYIDIGDDNGKTLLSTDCKQIRGKLYWAVADNVAFPIGSDGTFSFTIKGQDDDIDNQIEISGRFDGDTAKGTMKWIFPKRRSCDSDSLSWTIRT